MFEAEEIVCKVKAIEAGFRNVLYQVMPSITQSQTRKPQELNTHRKAYFLLILHV